MSASPDAGHQETSSLRVRHAAETLESSGHAVAALDVSGRVTIWNDRAATLSGWSARTVVGHPLHDVLVGPSRRRLAEGISALAAGQTWQAELDLEGPRGKVARIEVSADPVLFEGTANGSVLLLRALSADEVQRRFHELAMVLCVIPDAVVVVDAQARVREWNPAAEAMFGWSRTRMLGVPVQQLMSGQSREQFEQVWNQLEAGAPVAPYEAHREDRDGTAHLVSVHAAPLRENDSFLGAVATYRPVSTRQTGERLLAELTAEVPIVIVAYDQHSRVTFAAGGGFGRTGIGPAFAPGAVLLSTLSHSPSLHAAVARSLSGHTTQVQVLFDDRIWQCHVAPTEQGGFVSAVDVTSEFVVNDRLQALLAAAPLAFVTFDAEGRATFAAGSVFAELSVAPDDLVGLNLCEVYADTPAVTQALQRCLAGHRVDVVITARERVWDLHYRSYRDGNGAVTGGVCIAQDMTSWKADQPLEPGLPQ